jgi:5-formyltetrahydrofolate cyclo-ligase
MTKADIRKTVAAEKTTLTSEELEKKSAVLIEHLQRLDLFRSAQTIGAYIPLPGEVNVRPLFERGSTGGVALPEDIDAIGRANSPSEPLSRNGGSAGGIALPETAGTIDKANSSSKPLKQFFIPAFDETLDSYRMARYTPELKKGRFGIPEPEQPVWAAPDEIRLILVPAIAFDRAGGRLGRGGGFYDRLLPLYSAQRLGIGFSFQLLDAVPSEEHDIRMNALLTEKEFLGKPANNRQARRSEVYWTY